jgi:hypothetical protein
MKEISSPDSPSTPSSDSSFPVWIIIVTIVALGMIGAAVYFYMKIRNKRLQRDLASTYTTL